MKRKILILLCAVALVFSMGVTVFASTVKLPVFTEETSYIIVRDGSIYLAIPKANINFDQSNYRRTPYYYKLVGNSWVKETSDNYSTYAFNADTLMYDGTGLLGNVSKIEWDNPVGFDDFTAYYDGLKGQVTVKNVVGVLAVGATAIVGIAFMWWGVRKLVRGLMAAFRKGKASL